MNDDLKKGENWEIDELFYLSLGSFAVGVICILFIAGIGILITTIKHFSG